MNTWYHIYFKKSFSGNLDCSKIPKVKISLKYQPNIGGEGFSFFFWNFYN